MIGSFDRPGATDRDDDPPKCSVCEDNRNNADTCQLCGQVHCWNCDPCDEQIDTKRD